MVTVEELERIKSEQGLLREGGRENVLAVDQLFWSHAEEIQEFYNVKRPWQAFSSGAGLEAGANTAEEARVTVERALRGKS